MDENCPFAFRFQSPSKKQTAEIIKKKHTSNMESSIFFRYWCKNKNPPHTQKSLLEIQCVFSGSPIFFSKLVATSVSEVPFFSIPNSLENSPGWASVFRTRKNLTFSRALGGSSWKAVISTSTTKRRIQISQSLRSCGDVERKLLGWEATTSRLEVVEVFFEEKGPRWMQWSSWGLPQGQTKMNRICSLFSESNCSHQTHKKIRRKKSKFEWASDVLSPKDT